MATDYRTILVKRGSADDWAASTIPLQSGEWGLDETNRIAKMGDGFNLWDGLPAVGGDLPFDPQTGLYAPAEGDPIPSVDGNNQMPTAVRNRIAANLADPDTPEGAAIAAETALPADVAKTSTQNTFPERQAFGPDGTTAYYGFSSGQQMTYTDADHKLKIAHYQQSQILGDWTADTSLNPGVLFGRNSFTVVGKNPGDGKGVKGIYGELIEVDVQSPDAAIPFVVGLQSEAAFANAAAGATVTSMTSHKVAAPSRKDGATGGTATTVYGLYVDTVASGVLGSTNAYSVYVKGGLSLFDAGTLQGKSILAADKAQLQGMPTAGARLWAVGNSTSNNVVVVQNYPGGSATVDPIKLLDADGTTQLFGITAAGSLRLRGAVLQTTVGAAGTAAAIPGNPKKWWRLTDSDGSTVVVPVYAAS